MVTLRFPLWHVQELCVQHQNRMRETEEAVKAKEAQLALARDDKVCAEGRGSGTLVTVHIQGDVRLVLHRRSVRSKCQPQAQAIWLPTEFVN